MTIGELAKRAGIGIETVRYYQRRGLIPEPPRPARGFRKYTAETLQLLQFIRRAKGLGFSLKEIRSLLAMRGGRRGSQDLVQLMSSKESEIAGKIHELEVKRRALQRLRTVFLTIGNAERWRLFESTSRDD